MIERADEIRHFYQLTAAAQKELSSFAKPDLCGQP